jgi:hypothetical protein
VAVPVRTPGATPEASHSRNAAAGSGPIAASRCSNAVRLASENATSAESWPVAAGFCPDAVRSAGFAPSVAASSRPT